MAPGQIKVGVNVHLFGIFRRGVEHRCMLGLGQIKVGVGVGNSFLTPD